VGFEITGLRTIYKGWTELKLVSLNTPSGEAIEREVEDHGAAIAVLPYDPERKCALLVRQHRLPIAMTYGEDETLEAIAGIIENETPEDAVKREAWEEGGVRLDALEKLGSFWTMPGLSTERMTFFFAPYSAAQRSGEGGGIDDEHENITVVEMSLAELARAADGGALSDQKTFTLIQTLRLRMPELFEA
jgi:nudix-type nucleoside diphosphatase (YffH/AdpP family)